MNVFDYKRMRHYIGMSLSAIGVICVGQCLRLRIQYQTNQLDQINDLPFIQPSLNFYLATYLSCFISLIGLLFLLDPFIPVSSYSLKMKQRLTVSNHPEFIPANSIRGAHLSQFLKERVSSCPKSKYSM